MRLTTLATILAAFFYSCTFPGSSDKYKDYVMSATDKDTLTTEMMRTRDFSNSIFINQILLKDGQHSTAGLGFVMEIDSKKYFVTAKHLLGPDGGFKDTIKPEMIAETVADWKAQSLPASADFSVSTNDMTAAQGDVLIFNSVSPKQGLASHSFKLSKLTIPVNGNMVLVNGQDISNSFYLVAYDSSNKEILLPLQLIGKYQEYYLFHKEKQFDYHGFSGGPILDAKGNVFAILSAAIENNGIEQIAGTKIRPLNLK